MVKVLNREDIQRMVGRGAGSVGSGGSSEGGGGISLAQVDAAYVSKEFFSQLFTVNGKRTYIDPETEEEVTEDVIISPNQIAGGEYSLSNVEVSVGLWTQQFLSALGLNSGGGGSGATALSELVDVALSNPQNGQALVYNSSTGKWVNGTVTPDLSDYATKAWVQQQNYITASALTGYATQQWVQQQGYITASALTGYATQQWVGQQGYATQQWVQQQNYITASALNGYATQQWVEQQNYLTSHQSVDGTFWGQSWTNHGTVKGSIEAGSNGGQITGFHFIELNNHGTLSGYGGYIDFHYNGSSADYTSRIIEDASGRLFFDVSAGVRIGSALLSWDSANNALKIQKIDGTAANLEDVGIILQNGQYTVMGRNEAHGALIESLTNTVTMGLHNGSGVGWDTRSGSGYMLQLVYDSSNTVAKKYTRVYDGLRIGDGMLVWDSTNNALKAIKADGTSINFYATGGVSALGMSAGVSTVDAMTFNNLSVNNSIKFNSSVNVIVGGSSQMLRNANDSDCIYLLNFGSSSKVTSSNYYFNQYDNVGLHGTNYNYDETWWIDPDGCAKFNRLYLDSTRYIYVNGGTLYYFNGSTSRQIAFA